MILLHPYYIFHHTVLQHSSKSLNAFIHLIKTRPSDSESFLLRKSTMIAKYVQIAGLRTSGLHNIFQKNAIGCAVITSLHSTAETINTSRNRNFHTLNTKTKYQLCFLRHGQSTWNRDNRFIGWTDTPLTDDGVLEARVAGQMLTRSGMKFDEVHTSLLRRCIRTTNLVLMEMGQEYIPVHKNWRMNERHYGDLVGKNKKEVVKLFGKDQVRRWRRSWDEPPPAMVNDHPFHPALDPRYRDVSVSIVYTCFFHNEHYVLRTTRLQHIGA